MTVAHARQALCFLKEEAFAEVVQTHFQSHWPVEQRIVRFLHDRTLAATRFSTDEVALLGVLGHRCGSREQVGREDGAMAHGTSVVA